MAGCCIRKRRAPFICASHQSITSCTTSLRDTHRKTGFSNTTSGSITFPCSSLAFDISRVASIEAITIHTEDSTKWYPGHFLRGDNYTSMIRQVDTMQIFHTSAQNQTPLLEGPFAVLSPHQLGLGTARGKTYPLLGITLHHGTSS